MSAVSATSSSRDLAVVVRGLRKKFGSVVALDGVDLEVPTGTVLGLLGPNGAGKTTTVRILTTVLAPDAGEATVLGIDVTRDPQGVRERIGLAGQYAAVDENLTGRENLRLIGRLTHQPSAVVRRRGDELLERFGLADASDRLAKTYSGGMRRRLDLAAALVHRPPVLLLDEPTTGLDIASRMELWQVIQELVATGTTLLLTTQYLEEADRLADDIVVIDEGRVVAHGAPAELKRGLGDTILELELAAPGEASRAAAVLGGIGTASVNGNGRVVEVCVEGGRQVLDAVRALDNAGICPDHLAIREPTLDDAFLVLTGHRPHSSSTPSDQPTPAGAKHGGGS
jgi:daunorubicin resistance ABC transporter ATP-binding subunit